MLACKPVTKELHNVKLNKKFREVCTKALYKPWLKRELQ